MTEVTTGDATTDGRRMRTILTLAASAGFVTSPFWSPGFGGFDADQFPIPQTDPPAQPAGYAFAIWGVIYVWLAVSALFGLFFRAEDPDWDAARLPLMASLVLGIPWITVATISPVWASVLIWAMLLTALWALWRAPGHDRWMFLAPVGLYAGWLSAASLVSIALLGAGYGFGPDAMGWAWIVVLIAIAGGIAVQRGLARTPLYGLGIAWALVAVSVRNGLEAPGLSGLALLGALALVFFAFRAQSN